MMVSESRLYILIRGGAVEKLKKERKSILTSVVIHRKKLLLLNWGWVTEILGLFVWNTKWKKLPTISEKKDLSKELEILDSSSTSATRCNWDMSIPRTHLDTCKRGYKGLSHLFLKAIFNVQLLTQRYVPTQAYQILTCGAIFIADYVWRNNTTEINDSFPLQVILRLDQYVINWHSHGNHHRTTERRLRHTTGNSKEMPLDPFIL